MNVHFISVLGPWTVVLGLLTLAGHARAEEGDLDEEEPEEGVAEAAPRTAWLIVEGALGVNGVTDDDYLEPAEVRLYPLLGFAAAAYVRPMEYLSAGVQLTYGLLTPYSEEVGVGASGFFAISAFARGQYAFGPYEPWIAGGLGYARAHGAATGPRSSQAGTVTLNALAIDLSIGLAVEVMDRLTVGPFARFVFGLWANGCQDLGTWPFDVQEDGCDDIEPLYGHELPRLPHLWVVGANVAYWLM